MGNTKSGENKTYLIIVPFQCTRIHIGGIETFVASLYNQLKKSHHYTPLILAPIWEEPKQKGDFAKQYNCIYYRLRTPFDVENKKWFSLFSFLAHLPTSLFSLYRLLKKNRVAIINIQHFDYAPIFLLSIARRLRLFKGKLILSVHNFDPPLLGVEGPQKSEILRNVVKFIFSSSDSIISCSESLKKEFVTLFPTLESRIHVVHNGIDTNYFTKQVDPLFKLPEELKNTNIITHVGQFQERKGNELLVQAFMRIHHKISNLRLVLIGSVGHELKKVRNLVLENGLTEKVHIFVNMPNNKIPDFLSASRIFVLPSNKEPFGIAILEAAACKLPVIATNVGGIPEIIKHNENGILVEKNNVEQLADAIMFMLENPEIAKKMGESLYNSLDRFTFNKVYEAYMNIASA